MMENRIIVGLGEALWDCLPEGRKIGGAPANFAYHASQFGYEAHAVSAVGNDALGDETIEALKANGLKLCMPRVDFPTGQVLVSLDEDGVASYDIKEGSAWDNIPFTPEMEQLAGRCSAVCFGSLAQRNEVSRNAIYRFLNATPKGCMRIFDINLPQNFYSKEVIQESLRRCNVMKINDEELVIIGRMFGYPGLDIENKCWLILGKYNLDMLVLTCGVNGSYVFSKGALPGDSQGGGGRHGGRRRLVHGRIRGLYPLGQDHSGGPSHRCERECLCVYPERCHARHSRGTEGIAYTLLFRRRFTYLRRGDILTLPMKYIYF